MRITSWNVNGIRAVAQKGFFERLNHDNPDILCLQETKAFEHQLSPEFKYLLKDYRMVWHSGQKPGYAGTAIFYKNTVPVVSTKNHFEEITHFHDDGRVVEMQFGNIVLLNIYFPNGGEKADGTEMLSYKLSFYEKYLAYIDGLVASGKYVITCGDFNICHKEIDIARPKENESSIGFLPIERAELDKLVRHRYIDVFRYFNPELKDQYTWWSYRAGARPRNVGWRLDYFWVNEGFLPYVKSVEHQTQVIGSDHCPISMNFEL